MKMPEDCQLRKKQWSFLHRKLAWQQWNGYSAASDSHIVTGRSGASPQYPISGRICPPQKCDTSSHRSPAEDSGDCQSPVALPAPSIHMYYHPCHLCSSQKYMFSLRSALFRDIPE